MAVLRSAYYDLYSLDSNAPPHYPKERVSDSDHPNVLVGLALSDGQCAHTIVCMV
jgi:hypothetical protein